MTFLAVLGAIYLATVVVGIGLLLATAIVDRLFSAGKPKLRIER